MTTRTEELTKTMAWTLKTLKRFDELNARFEKYAAPEDVTAFVLHCAKLFNDFPQIRESCHGISIKELCSLDETTLCARLDRMEEETPGDFADIIDHLLYTYKTIQAYYTIKSSYLDDWLNKRGLGPSPLLMFTYNEE